jgi:hypothetical protein
MRKIETSAILFVLILPAALAQDIVVLGAPGMEGELVHPRHIQEGPDGNIYVYDEVDAYIKVYSPQGKFLRKMGGEGQGPGEIMRRTDFFFSFTRDGRLFFAEFFRGHRWITLMKLSGELDRILKIDLPQSFGIGRAAALADGGFLAEFHFSSEPEKQKDYYLWKSPISVRLVDKEGRMGAEVIKTNYYSRISYIPDGGDSGIPYSPYLHWCLFKDQTLLCADGTGSKIEVYDLRGKLVKAIETQLPEPEKVKDRDLDQWREERKRQVRERNPDWYNRFGSVIEKYTSSIYKVKPMMDGLSVTPAGNILVAGAWDPETSSRTYWLVDEAGKTTARIEIAAAIELTKSFIFVVRTDEESNMQVRCLKRSGSDKDDFLRAASL